MVRPFDQPQLSDSASLADAIDAIRDAFEAEWIEGRRPNLDDFLQRVPEAHRTDLLIDLVALDVENRQRRGDWPALSEYSARYPEAIGRLAREIEWPSDSQDGSIGSTARDATATPADPTDAPPGEISLLRPGDHLGRYRLEESIGRGGFGDVWRGFDPQLHRAVAIKVPRPDRLGPASVEQFLREGRKLAALRHPGIVAVYDVGRDAGRCFIVSELIEGGTLEDRLKDGPLDPMEAARLTAAVAEALHHAHLRNIVHRDLKPSNILLESDGRPRLTDFGLAVTEEEQRAHAGRTAGTLPYMSPEQVRGETHHLDARSDVYGLGAVLYELLCGRPPFIAPTREELPEQILNREPRPPRTINDAVPSHLENVCLRCLSKDVRDRYNTAADLKQALLSDSATDRPAARGVPLRLVLAAVAAAIVVLAAGGGYWWLHRPGTAGDGTPPADAPAALAALDDDAALRPDALPIAANRGNLLARPPVPVVWFPHDEFDSYSAEEHWFQLSATNISHFAVGRSTGGPQTLHAEFSAEDWIGYAGVFWGLRDERDPKTEAWKCYTVVVGRMKADEEFMIRLQEHIVVPMGVGQFVPHQIIPWYRSIPLPEGNVVTLDVELTATEIRRIRVDGESIWTARGAAEEFPWPSESGTQFGLTALEGEFAFHRFSVR